MNQWNRPPYLESLEDSLKFAWSAVPPYLRSISNTFSGTKFSIASMADSPAGHRDPDATELDELWRAKEEEAMSRVMKERTGHDSYKAFLESTMRPGLAGLYYSNIRTQINRLGGFSFLSGTYVVDLIQAKPFRADANLRSRNMSPSKIFHALNQSAPEVATQAIFGDIRYFGHNIKSFVDLFGTAFKLEPSFFDFLCEDALIQPIRLRSTAFLTLKNLHANVILVHRHALAQDEALPILFVAGDFHRLTGQYYGWSGLEHHGRALEDLIHDPNSGDNLISVQEHSGRHSSFADIYIMVFKASQDDIQSISSVVRLSF